MLTLLLTSTVLTANVELSQCIKQPFLYQWLTDVSVTAKKEVFQSTVNCLISSVISCLTARKLASDLSHYQLPDSLDLPKTLFAVWAGVGSTARLWLWLGQFITTWESSISHYRIKRWNAWKLGTFSNVHKTCQGQRARKQLRSWSRMAHFRSEYKQRKMLLPRA